MRQKEEIQNQFELVVKDLATRLTEDLLHSANRDAYLRSKGYAEALEWVLNGEPTDPNVVDKQLYESLEENLRGLLESYRKVKQRESCYQRELARIKNELTKFAKKIDTTPHSRDENYGKETLCSNCSEAIELGVSGFYQCKVMRESVIEPLLYCPYYHDKPEIEREKILKSLKELEQSEDNEQNQGN